VCTKVRKITTISETPSMTRIVGGKKKSGLVSQFEQ